MLGTCVSVPERITPLRLRMERLAHALLVGLLFTAAPAHAYTVVGEGRLVRMDVLAAWDDGVQVLAYSPVVEGPGVLVAPVPAAAVLVPGPDPTLLDLGVDRVVDPRRSTGAKPSRPALLGPYKITIPPIAIGTGSDIALVATASDDRLRDFDPGAYAGPDYKFLVITLPGGEGPVRLRPVAVRFPSDQISLPIRLAGRTPPHSLSLGVLAHAPLTDLGGMEFVVGLRRAGDDKTVADEAGDWAAAALGSQRSRWVYTRFAAPVVNTPNRPVGKVEFSLPVPVAATPSPTAEVERTPAKDSCLGCSSGGALSWALLLLVAPLRRQMSRV